MAFVNSELEVFEFFTVEVTLQLVKSFVDTFHFWDPIHSNFSLIEPSEEIVLAVDKWQFGFVLYSYLFTVDVLIAIRNL